MNPYDAPKQELPPEPKPKSAEVAGYVKGKPCLACGSANTGRDELSRSKPSVLYFILFGWLSLLIHGAFAKRIERCRDCGAMHRYKSAGSRLALVVLILMVIGAVMELRG